MSGGGEPRREEEEEELDLHYKVVEIGILVEEAQTFEAICSDKCDRGKGFREGILSKKFKTKI